MTQAVDAAERAFPAWRETPPAKRARILFRFHELLLEHATDVAAAADEDIEIELDDAKERVYGMPYSVWKSDFQK